MNEKEKTTVPIPPVGTDGEQSLSYVSNEIITAETEEINPIDESMEEMLRQMQRMSDPSYLATMTITTDSRDCPEGSIFLALKGASFDGNKFADMALEKGCAYVGFMSR